VLDDEQIVAIARYQDGVEKVRDAIERLNELAVDFQLDIRVLPTYPLGLVMADTQHIMMQHGRDIQQAQDDAVERLNVEPGRVYAIR